MLTGQVLRLVNSAYYALRVPVTSLARAIILLGLNTVKNLVLGTAILERLTGKNFYPALAMEAFWLHSIATAIGAKTLAGLMPQLPVDREECFLAGLLHDIGKIPLNASCVAQYARVLETVENRGEVLHRVETQTLGVDHLTVGGLIADKWQLPALLGAAIRYHHDPERAEDPYRPVAQITALANQLVNWFGIGSAGDTAAHRSFEAEAAQREDLAGIDLVALEATVLKEIDSAQMFLTITHQRG